ncbi:MAG TPA: GNAT family N-acetyltransferase [Allosphingosinicella sp.]|nr:GNAT family N-acetyltransferase [Allosphingosinicella sp.]
MKLRPAAPRDAEAIAAIYAAFVTGSAVSFETEAPGPEEMAARLASGGALYPWLVAEEEGGALVGYAYAAPFRARTAYRFTVETTVYLRPGAGGRGLGRALYAPLLELLAAQGFTQAIAAIALPNDPSVRLHERLGFAAAGIYRKVGWKLGEWWDVGLWQRKLANPSRPPEEPRPWAEFQSILT